MNNIDKIKELQEELSGILFSVDQLLKDKLETETKFIDELKKEYIENLNLGVSLTIFKEILKLHDEGKTNDEIKKSLVPLKNNTGRRVAYINNQMRAARDIKQAKDKYSLEQLNEFSNTYAEVLRTYHPLITLTNDRISITTFNTLRQFYMVSNIDAFNGVFKEHPIPLHEFPNQERAIQIYESNIKLYKEQLEKIKTDDKIAKMKEIINDDALIAREETALRQQNYKLKQDFNNLKTKIQSAFPEGINDILK